MSEKVQVTIIGGGVVGCAVAYQLSKRFKEIFIFEKNEKIKAENQSSRNSGVIHAGVYYPKDLGALKGKLCVEGNALLYDFCEEFDIPHKKVGKLIVAVEKIELEYLENTLNIAIANGVPGAKMITREQAKKMEPNIECLKAAYFPTSGVVEATSLVYQLYSLASQNGAFFLTGTEVVDITPQSDTFKVTTKARGNIETFETEILINAAGLYSDEIAKKVNPDFPYTVQPLRGEAAKFYKNRRPQIFHAGMNVYPTPYPVYPSGEKAIIPFKEFIQLFEKGKILKTVGVHLTPLFDVINGKYDIGNTVMIGPASKGDIKKDNYSDDLFPEDHFLKLIHGIFPHLVLDDVSLYQAGIQAKLKERYDYVIEPDERHPHCINLVGIDSPGLTACLAIGNYVDDLIKKVTS